MANFLEELKKYFGTTPQNIIFEDWAKHDIPENKVGPTVEDFLAHCHLYKLQSADPLNKQLPQFSEYASSSKFSSGFFYHQFVNFNGKSSICLN